MTKRSLSGHHHTGFISRKRISGPISLQRAYGSFASIIDATIHLQGHAITYSNRNDSCSTLYTHHSVELGGWRIGPVRDVHMQVGEDGCKSSPVCVKAPIATPCQYCCCGGNIAAILGTGSLCPVLWSSSVYCIDL